jgi:hypothetical protein
VGARFARHRSFESPVTSVRAVFSTPALESRSKNPLNRSPARVLAHRSYRHKLRVPKRTVAPSGRSLDSQLGGVPSLI